MADICFVYLALPVLSLMTDKHHSLLFRSRAIWNVLQIHFSEVETESKFWIIEHDNFTSLPLKNREESSSVVLKWVAS